MAGTYSPPPRGLFCRRILRKGRGMLRATKWIAVLTGAVGSAASTLYVGRHNSSPILIGLFVVWVLSPFVGLAVADPGSKRWSVLALAVTLASLGIYGDAVFNPPRERAAFVFLMVPLGSWLLLAIATFLSKRHIQPAKRPS